MSWDKMFKLSSKFYFKGFVKCDVDVGVLNRYIDTIIDTSDVLIQSFEIPNIFKEKKGEHILEYKSERDQLLPGTFPKLMGYTGFFLSNKKVGIKTLNKNLFSWLVISGNHPQYQELKKDIQLSRIDNGIYESISFKGFFLLQTDELNITEENKLFLINASVEKFKKFLAAIIHKEIEISESEKKYIRERFYINYKELSAMTEAKEAMDLLGLQNLKEAIKDAGLKDVINTIGKEDVINTIGKEDVINTIGKEDVINTIGEDEILNSIDEKKIREFLAKKDLNK